MERRVPLPGVLLLAALLLTASAPAPLAGQKAVEFTVPDCQ